MNNRKKSDQDNNKKIEPQICFELDGSVFKCSLSSFNNIVEREITNCMSRSQKNTDIVSLNDLVNIQNWKKKFKKLETQAKMLDSIGSRLKRDLKINKFAQPMRCLSASVNQHVIVTVNKKAKMARDAANDALNGSKKKCQVFTISDSEDDDVIITHTSNVKPIRTKNDNIIDLIDLDNDTENLEVNNKPAPKSKINCESNSEDNPVIITDTSKIKPIPTKNDNIIDLIDLDNDTENLEVNNKPAPKSKINSEDNPVIITDTSKIKPIPTKNDNIIDLIDLDNDTENLEVNNKPAPKSKINCESNSEDNPVIITDTSKIKPIPTKNDDIIDLIDLDNDTENLKVEYKPDPKSKTNCKSNSEVDPVIITDTSKIKPIPTKNDDIIDLDNDTENLKVEYKPDPKSKTNCKSNSEVDPVIITGTSKIKPIPTKNDIIIDIMNLDNDTQNLEVKFKPALKSKTNVSLPDLKTNDNYKVLPIKTEVGKTLSNGGFLSTTIQKRKPGPKSKTMFVSDMVPLNAENEETPAKKMRSNECEVINNKESNTINLLSCKSEPIKKYEVSEKFFFKLKSSSLKYPPPYPDMPPYRNQPSWKNVPPIPNMTVEVSENTVTLIWDMNLSWQIAEIKLYELFVCQESEAPPHTSMWKKKGNIIPDNLPMACELEVFELGHIYYFALRAVDVHDRRGPCAVQKTKI